MTLEDLLTTLRAKGVRIAVEGEKLRCFAPEGAMDPELAAAIRVHKSSLVKLLSSAARVSAPQRQEIPRRASDGPAPLSFTQERMWFHEQAQGSGAMYNIALTLPVFEGAIDATALRRACNVLLERHSILRSRFAWIDGEPRQTVVDGVVVEPVFHVVDEDPATVDRDTRVDRVREWVREHAHVPFDLSRAPLFRCHVLTANTGWTVVLLVMHHIVSDGWSNIIVIRELASLYRSFAEGRPYDLPPPAIQYADYAEWQRKAVAEGGQQHAQLDYWVRRLTGLPAVLELPLDRPRPPIQRHVGASHQVVLPDEAASALRTIAKQEDASLFMILLALFHLAIWQMTGRRDFAIGSPLALRDRSELEGLVGPCLNVIMLRNAVDTRQSFRAFLRQVRQTALEGFDHRLVPFERVVAALKLPRSLAYDPLCQVMFALKATPKGELTTARSAEAAEELAVNTRDVAGFSRLDLTLLMKEEHGKISGWFEYNSEIFDQATIRRLGLRLAHIAASVSTEPDSPLRRLDLLGDEERQFLMAHSRGPRSLAPPAPFIERFLSQPALRPAVRVRGSGVTITYGALATASQILATRLVEAGIGPEDRVAVALDRSPQLIAAVVAVLRAGAVYVPLDVANHSGRNLRILSRAGVKLVLCDEASRPLFGDLPHLVVDAGIWNQRPGAVLECRAPHPEQTAYIIHTSGTTGTPKGVMVSHGALARYLDWSITQYLPTVPSVVPLTLPIAFDASITPLLAPLYAGHAIEVGDPADPLAGLADGLGSGGYGFIKLTPSQWSVLLDRNPRGQPLTERWVLGGEALPPSLVSRGLSLFPQSVVINEYGPTEATVGCTTEWLSQPFDASHVSIGTAIGECDVYVLDEDFRLAGRGAVGEIFIGGNTLARGYLDDPAATADKFIPDPFGNSGNRLYRTGDLGRYLPDGRILYLGRTDSQIKVRGIRVEPAEIESTVSGLPGVARSAVALVSQRGAGILAALVVPEAGATVVPEAIKAALRTLLPDYMCPAVICPVETIPTTSNGKVDTRAVAEIVSSQSGRLDGEPLRTDVERRLGNIWCQLLELDRVYADDEFFQLGGHSLLFMKMLFRIEEDFGLSLKVQDVFDRPVLRDMAAHVDLRLLRSRLAAPTRDADLESLII